MTGMFKAVPPNGVTRGTLDWNHPTGTVIRCDHNVGNPQVDGTYNESFYIPDHGDVCPKWEGDGISIAKTWRGAALAGHTTVRCCTVTIDPADVLAEDDHKIRVRAVTIGEWFDATELLRQGLGRGADLRYADLRGADLRAADLRYADLRYADLGDANLRDANLRAANLGDANLGYANLRYANLGDANLGYADLRYANLRDANLRAADLRYANLGDWKRDPVTGYARKVAS